MSQLSPVLELLAVWFPLHRPPPLPLPVPPPPLSVSPVQHPLLFSFSLSLVWFILCLILLILGDVCELFGDVYGVWFE